MKVLVTSGCSFSECISPWIETWPKHLERHIRPNHSYHEGLGCQGNDNISRQIIFRVTEILKTPHNHDLLVGIMWSGFDRKSILVNKNTTGKITTGMTIPGKFGESPGVYNPYNWTNSTDDESWLILGGDEKKSKLWYTEFHHDLEAQLTTLEHILRIQWFLGINKIKYFMTTYTSEVFNSRLIENVNVKYLYNLIDFTKFLPITGEYEWCKTQSGLAFPIDGDPHPSTEQHKLFTNQVIIPYLESQDYI